MIRNNPIGIFDSGVGGLTVLKEIEKVLPAENIIYFGDTARVPYGNKSKETIIKFSTENVLFLLGKNVKLIIVACNTASALALDYLQKIFSVPVIGVIDAGVRKALAVSAHKKIGVIGTKSTIASGSYEREIAKYDAAAAVYARSCPLFVPLVEEGILKGKIVEEALQLYLTVFKEKKVDSLILGCTHYPLLRGAIGAFLKTAAIIDSAAEVAAHTREILENKRLITNKNRAGKKEFYVTDEPKGFSTLAKLFLNQRIIQPKVIRI